jgi:hypothetical protein
MKPLVSLLALAGVLSAGSPDAPKVSRKSVAAMEKSFDQKLVTLWPEPFLLLGTARGFYLDGFGAIFSAEMNLVTGPNVTPFHPEMSKLEIEQHRKKKLERLPVLRQAMKQMLTDAAASLDSVPVTEQIVVEVTVVKYPWEDMTGIPTQILMQAQKKKLLDAQRGAGDAAIHVQEF